MRMLGAAFGLHGILGDRRGRLGSVAGVCRVPLRAEVDVCLTCFRGGGLRGRHLRDAVGCGAWRLWRGRGGGTATGEQTPGLTEGTRRAALTWNDRRSSLAYRKEAAKDASLKALAWRRTAVESRTVGAAQERRAAPPESQAVFEHEPHKAWVVNKYTPLKTAACASSLSEDSLQPDRGRPTRSDCVLAVAPHTATPVEFRRPRRATATCESCSPQT